MNEQLRIERRETVAWIAFILMLIAIVGIIAVTAMFFEQRRKTREKAVEHECGQYSSTTGEFFWHSGGTFKAEDMLK